MRILNDIGKTGLRLFILIPVLWVTCGCEKHEITNPFDPECPRELWTPSGLSASQQGNGIVLSWSQANQHISGFRIERKAGGNSWGPVGTVPKGTTTWTDSDLKGSVLHEYRLVAYAGSNSSNQLTIGFTPVFQANVTTVTPWNITCNSAISGGNIPADGGSAVTERGVCWNTSGSPTVADNKTSNGTGTGSFTANLTGLAEKANYYVRAYATNSRGTAYGNQESFTTPACATIPTVVTALISSFNHISAVGGGNVTSDGGSPVTARGVCWNTAPNPTIGNNRTINGSGTGSFTSNLTGLTPNTLYYVRAYAVNSLGIAYGTYSVSFTTNPAVIDFDGNIYPVIAIGTQVWMAENLRTTRYNNGAAISYVTASSTWTAITAGAYCWQNNDNSYSNTYGALYNWFAVNTGILCPKGWHVPSDSEWNTLASYLINNGYGYQGSGNDIAKSLSAKTNWAPYSLAGTPGNDLNTNNSSGFSALPGGYRHMNGSFYDAGFGANWWTATNYLTSNAYYWSVYYNNNTLNRLNAPRTHGASVRCIRD